MPRACLSSRISRSSSSQERLLRFECTRSSDPAGTQKQQNGDRCQSRHFTRNHEQPLDKGKGPANHTPMFVKERCSFPAHGLNEDRRCTDVRQVRLVQDTVHNKLTKKQGASGIRFLHNSCAQETLLHLRILRVRRSLNSVQIQQGQLFLVMKNTFLVLVSWISRYRYRLWRQDSSQIVGAGVVLDFQIL